MFFWLLALVTVAGTACDGGRPASSPSHADGAVEAGAAGAADAHATDLRSAPAQRIVSLLPSATDVLIAIGAGDRLVGRTSYDTDSSLRTLPLVGGATNPSVETILALAPDLVVSWANVADRGIDRQLVAANIKVVPLPALDTADLFHAIARLGTLTGRDSAADALTARVHAELNDVRRSVEGRRRPTVLYVAWNNPVMTVGPRTFVGQLIALAGGTPLFPELSADWPTVALEEVVRRQPDVLVFPAGEMPGTTAEALAQLPGWRSLEAVRRGRVVHLPIELVHRSGPHVAAAARALRDALHPDITAAR